MTKELHNLEKFQLEFIDIGKGIVHLFGVKPLIYLNAFSLAPLCTLILLDLTTLYAGHLVQFLLPSEILTSIVKLLAGYLKSPHQQLLAPLHNALTPSTILSN